ncbi:NADP-dependent oxidoreductase [Tumebacillus sp. DT12]|uniref:NADP-dependent oxidoreductase n=1 Tax=Tumebacillus lacus TaxID=2995335 RepID=A0ABT3X026_9BACL|nr:NADP-dependent oxidoreductase [Tumebacillus lacus]MCX7569122.1 NADP-dependent oxidoreductase [Tumebacillus lacus]
MTKINRQYFLTEFPKGMPTEETFRLVETTTPELEEGQVLVRTVYLSVDPYMRGRMSGVKTYIDPFTLDRPLTGGVVGQVEASKDANFEVGEIVAGLLDWADYTVASGKHLKKVPAFLKPVSAALGVAGMPGCTAYFGLLDIGQPKEGETVVVSGAAGAVGTVVGQIAKIKGCRVVGIAGGPDKVAYLRDELGFDEVIDYKAGDLREALQAACPNGVDIYFDNVGGTISDEVMRLINFHARIILCGQIADYNLEKPEQGPRHFGQLLVKSAMAKGFIVSNYNDRMLEGITQIGQWLGEGKLKFRETITEGLENTPQAFLGLFRGENTGKMLVKVSDVQGQ